MPPRSDWIKSLLPELLVEALDMGGPLGEDQAVPAAFQRGYHVVDDLSGAGVVSDEVAIDGCHPTGLGGVGVTGVAEPGLVHVDYGYRRLDGVLELELRRVVAGRRGGLCDGVADRAELERDQVVEFVAA